MLAFYIWGLRDECHADMWNLDTCQTTIAPMQGRYQEDVHSSRCRSKRCPCHSKIGSKSNKGQGNSSAWACLAVLPKVDGRGCSSSGKLELARQVLQRQYIKCSKIANCFCGRTGNSWVKQETAIPSCVQGYCRATSIFHFPNPLVQKTRCISRPEGPCCRGAQLWTAHWAHGLGVLEEYCLKAWRAMKESKAMQSIRGHFHFHFLNHSDICSPAHDFCKAHLPWLATVQPWSFWRVLLWVTEELEPGKAIAELVHDSKSAVGIIEGILWIHWIDNSAKSAKCKVKASLMMSDALCKSDFLSCLGL